MFPRHVSRWLFMLSFRWRLPLRRHHLLCRQISFGLFARAFGIHCLPNRSLWPSPARAFWGNRVLKYNHSTPGARARRLHFYFGRNTTNERVRCRQTESTCVSLGSSELTIFLYSATELTGC